MDATERDAQIMREAAAQRTHDLKVAEIDARTKQEEARQTTLRRESRHQMLIWIAAFTAVVAVILTIVTLIANATSEDRAKEIKLREQQNQVAETCIRDHNIWLDGDCIPANKS